jgi:hypothetical protein
VIRKTRTKKRRKWGRVKGENESGNEKEQVIVKKKRQEEKISC